MQEDKNTDFIITFGTSANEVSSDTLLQSLFSVTNIIHEINKEVSPEKRIEIKVKALRPGSFEVVSCIQEVQTQSASLFGQSEVEYLAGIVTIFLGIYEIKKFLKGEQPKEQIEVDAGIKITNVAGDVVVYDQKVVNIALGNQSISDLVSKQFEKLNEDDDVRSFSIDAKNLPKFSADRNNFPELQRKYIVAQDKVKILERPNIYVKISRLAWDGGYKWGFVYEGNKIMAHIKDPNFFKRIDDGEKFSKGDALLVDLKIYQEFDQSIDGYVNQEYEISQVNKHIPRGEQLAFDN